jgi:hypothetical protein
MAHMLLENGLKWQSASIIIVFVHTSSSCSQPSLISCMALILYICLHSVEDARMSSKFKEELCHEVGCCVCACYDRHVKFSVYLCCVEH